MNSKNTVNSQEDIANIESGLTRESWKIFQIDEPQEVVNEIFNYYPGRSFEPSA